MSGVPLLLVWSAAGHAAGWVDVTADGQCAPTHPPRHRIEVVRDSFKRREDLAAVEDAVRARARTAMQASTCADRTPAQCEAIQAQVAIDVAVDHELRVVCAAALVSSGVVADPDGQQVHEARVRQAAARVAAGLGEAAVGVVDVQWSTGCGTGPAGATLAATLRAGLISAQARVTDGTGDRVVAKLSPGDPVTVELWHYGAGRTGTLVTTTQLAADWLGLYGSVGDQCHEGRIAGLEAGRRTGAGGLTVSLDLPIDGALCPGERVEATVRPSSAADVQLWSVGRTGEAWLTWSSSEDPQVAGPLDRKATLELEAGYLPALGEERLLVVAAPPGVRLPPATPGCRMSSLGDLPHAAALVAVPFTVAPAGRERCSAEEGGSSVSWDDYQSAPECR